MRARSTAIYFSPNRSRTVAAPMAATTRVISVSRVGCHCYSSRANALTKSGKSIKIQKVRTAYCGSQGASDLVTAAPSDPDGPVLTKRWKEGSETFKYGCNISDGRGTASLWDGTPSYQTAAGYGH